MGNEPKRQILVHNGVLSEEEIQKKLSVTYCPRWSLVNALDNQDSSSFDGIKAAEDMKLQVLKEKSLASHGTSKSSTKSLKHCPSH